jgi:hypothetical protein
MFKEYDHMFHEKNLKRILEKEKKIKNLKKENRNKIHVLGEKMK